MQCGLLGGGGHGGVDRGRTDGRSRSTSPPLAAPVVVGRRPGPPPGRRSRSAELKRLGLIFLARRLSARLPGLWDLLDLALRPARS